MSHGYRDTFSSITQTTLLAAEEQEEPVGAHGLLGSLPLSLLPPWAACRTGMCPGLCPGTGQAPLSSEQPGLALPLAWCGMALGWVYRSGQMERAMPQPLLPGLGSAGKKQQPLNRSKAELGEIETQWLQDHHQLFLVHVIFC